MMALKNICVNILSILLAIALSDSTFADEKWDVVVYGCTSAGIAAAIQAKRMNKSVIVVGPDQHLGGLSASGLGWTDSGNKKVVGGISREFYQRIKKVYDQKATWKWQLASEYDRYRPKDDAQWTFEPSVAEKVFEELVAENEIRVDRDQWLDREPEKGVLKEGTSILEIRMLSGNVYRGKMFIDATYEGDLMAAAGVSFTVGRESNAIYGETLNGVQIENAVSHQFNHAIDPYVVPGKPESGLLPRIHDGSPGKPGQGDHRIQAYNYRVCLTQVPDNRVPFPKPEGYDPGQYELLLRDLLAGSDHFKGKFDMLPNLKTDTNNHGSFSTDNIGMNYDYPTASYQRRREILDEHRQYQMGYFYFLANDPRIPEEKRKWMAKWGLAKDEFAQSGHWPHQIYVREARRMVSDFVVTEPHLRGDKSTLRSIGMGSYNMDSHNVQRYVDANGHARNEGDIQINPGGPYPVDFGAVIPRRDECTNLLVPVCVSASHIVYGSIRMEPVFMILGQSAATAAGFAIDDSKAIQDVAYNQLRERLLVDNQVLNFESTPQGIKLSTLDGIVIDDASLTLRQGWAVSESQRPFIHRSYRHDNDSRKGKLEATFQTTIPESGDYDVRLAWTPHPNRASNVPITITHSAGVSTLKVDQKEHSNSSGAFCSIGSFHFEKGSKASIKISNKGTNGFVIIDAVQFLKE